jgi:DNA-binding LacI/PurR family transcriptional regulator|tara:strand:- start:331 stop:612 length:282 start_codon:yes stop_codon:yes gene_type:complete
MKSYLQLVSDKAVKADVKLEDAFDKAGASHTTYWRTKNNRTEMKYDTALRVFNAIEELYQIQQGREYSQRLRETNQTVNRRSIRSRFKPRIVS